MVHGAYRFIKEMQGKSIESRTGVKRTNPIAAYLESRELMELQMTIRIKGESTRF